LRHGTEFPTVLMIETEGGQRHEHLVMEAIGKPSRWFTNGQLREKFNDCIAVVPGEHRPDALFDQLQKCDRANNVSSLVQDLRLL
jgi:hypothetical protein